MSNRRPAKPTRVTFKVTYEDGGIGFFSVDGFTLRTGDHVARIIARERQKTGELRAGPIVRVERA